MYAICTLYFTEDADTSHLYGPEPENESIFMVYIQLHGSIILCSIIIVQPVLLRFPFELGYSKFHIKHENYAV